MKHTNPDFQPCEKCQTPITCIEHLGRCILEETNRAVSASTGREPAPFGAARSEVQAKLAQMEAQRASGDATPLPTCTVGCAANAVTLRNGFPATSATSTNVTPIARPMTKKERKALKRKNAIPTTQGTSNTRGLVWPSACSHHGLKEIARIGHSGIYIAALPDIAAETGIALLVQVAKTFIRRDVEADYQLPKGYESLKEHLRLAPPTIQIDWPDGGIPPVKPTFWKALQNLLPPGRVVFACMGGHGRSGTAVAALLMQANGLSAEAAIAYVRKNHCDDAIETHGQEMYLKYLETWMKEQNAN